MSLFNSLCHRLCLSISVHKWEKQSKLFLPGSHYLPSFRELSESIWIVFLFQYFREFATVDIRSEVLRSKVHLPKYVYRSNSSRKFINTSCILYVVNAVTNFDVDIKITFWKTKKNQKSLWVLHYYFKQCFILKVLWLLTNFLSAHNCASVYWISK